MRAHIRPDGSILFDSYADLMAWVEGFVAQQRLKEHTELEPPELVPPPPINLARARPVSPPPVRKPILAADIEPPPPFRPRQQPTALVLKTPHWMPKEVRAFWATLGLRSREVIKEAIACGSGTSSKDLAAALKSPVSGLGKRISKLERDSKNFDPTLPVPVSLNGPNGEKEVQIDLIFLGCYEEANMSKMS